MIGILEPHFFLNRPRLFDVPNDIDFGPPARTRERGRGRRRSNYLCPYCLEDLQGQDVSPSVEELFRQKVQGARPTPKHCPICNHSIPDSLWGKPRHDLTREQEWDLLENEMNYTWKWERRDVESYIWAMGEHYNPDYMVAKDALWAQHEAMEAAVRLREEFLEAEGELDGLIAGYLDKKFGGPRLARELRDGRKWRVRAIDLSAEGALPRRTTEFQLEMVRNLSSLVYESWKEWEKVILYLKARLEELDKP